MILGDHVIGVCSWSLRCANNQDLVDAMKKLRLSHVQLALNPIVAAGASAVDATLQLFEKEGISITAGMVGFEGEDYTSIATIRQTGGFVPDARWDQRRRAAEAAARCAHALHLSMVSTHIGFVPLSSEAAYEKMIKRLREVADMYAGLGVALLMETGQESANELLQFLNDVARPNVGVNFDPANMILYGAGNPVDAVRILDRHVRHVHIKDAVASSQPGTLWGEEVPFGKGEVNAQAFLTSLRYGAYRGPLVIEREGGTSRFADAHHAIGVMEGVLTPRPSANGE